MKKRIAVCLSLLLTLSLLAFPVGAASLEESGQDTTPESVPEKVMLKSNGDNTYTLLGPVQEGPAGSQGDDLVYAEPILGWAMDLLALPEGGCLSKIGEDLYVAATQIKLDTKDFSKNYPLFERFDIDEGTIQSAKESIESQLELGNDDFEYNLYLTEHFSPYAAAAGEKGYGPMAWIPWDCLQSLCAKKPTAMSPQETPVVDFLWAQCGSFARTFPSAFSA